MPTVYRKNYSRRQVDCAEYSGDLIFEECNLAQEVPDTGQGAIFINTSNLTSLTCLNCNCVNHRQPPQGGVVYTGGNIAQVDHVATPYLDFNIGVYSSVRRQMLDVWDWIRSYMVANPTGTYQDFRDAFISSQGDTIFFADTLLTAIKDGVQNTFPSVTDYATVRDWVITYKDAINIRRVI